MTMTLRCSEDEDERGPDCNKWLQELSYNLRSVSSSATVVIKVSLYFSISVSFNMETVGSINSH
ncbi:hypothetical protein YC2023_061787 [Brassica napus]